VISDTTILVFVFIIRLYKTGTTLQCNSFDPETHASTQEKHVME